MAPDGTRQRQPLLLVALALAASFSARCNGEAAGGGGAAHGSHGHVAHEEVPGLEGMILPLHPRIHCMAGQQLSSFNEAYVKKLLGVSAQFSIVARPRLRATAFLCKAALLGARGDFVETGTYTGEGLDRGEWAGRGV